MPSRGACRFERPCSRLDSKLGTSTTWQCRSSSKVRPGTSFVVAPCQRRPGIGGSTPPTRRHTTSSSRRPRSRHRRVSRRCSTELPVAFDAHALPPTAVYQRGAIMVASWSVVHNAAVVSIVAGLLPCDLIAMCSRRPPGPHPARNARRRPPPYDLSTSSATDGPGCDLRSSASRFTRSYRRGSSAASRATERVSASEVLGSRAVARPARSRSAALAN